MSNEQERAKRFADQRAELRAKIPDDQKVVAALHEIAELLNTLNDKASLMHVTLQQIARNTASQPGLSSFR